MLDKDFPDWLELESTNDLAADLDWRECSETEAAAIRCSLQGEAE